MIPMEEWKTIAEFPEYAVSNLGRVKRLTASQGAVIGKVLKPYDSNGYLKVSLTAKDKKRKVAVHRLVLEAFVGKPIGKLDCCHWNGIRTDNRIDNLRWASRSENVKDAKRHGTFPIGEKNGQAKLTANDVKKIRDLKMTGHTEMDLAKMYNVSRGAISDICRMRNWRHI
jgi:hypothetical protein